MKKKTIVMIIIVFVAIAVTAGVMIIHGLSSASVSYALSEQQNEEKLSEIEAKPLTEAPHAALASAGVENREECPVSFFLEDLQYLDPASTIEMMKACQVSIISVPLVWRFLEKEEGKYDPSEYDALLEPYSEAGFRFIFLLDGGQRTILNQDGSEIAGYSLPGWLTAKSEIVRQQDFMGKQYGLSYNDPVARQYYYDFCRKTIEHFGTRFAASLYGFAPCIMNEFEMKYPQSGYAWTDHSESALDAFHAWLENRYGTAEKLNETLGTEYTDIGEIGFPVVTYGNSITSGALNDNPMFTDYMRFREDAIVEYIRPVTGMIREAGFASVAYFGQVLNGHDAIYGSGVVTKTAQLADTAVIDFNFYNGYDSVYDSIIPAMLVNYLHNAGYLQVWAGLYFERIPYLEHMDFLQETVDYIAQDGLAAGYEIGGISGVFRQIGMDARPTLKYGVTFRTEKPRIALYVSEWNFYKNHGEQVRYFDYFSDALAQMYKIVRFELGYPVAILCDEVILQGKLDDYDLLILPSQFYIEPSVRNAVEQYLAGGGKALMDFRFGEWDADGKNTGSWSDESFGIDGKEALKRVEVRLKLAKDGLPGMDAEYLLRSYYPAVPNLYATNPEDEKTAHPLYQDEAGKNIGMVTDQTIVLGFQPQIQYKYAQAEEERSAAVQVIRGAIEYLLPDAR